MPFLRYKDIKISGVAACVPKEILSNIDKGNLRSEDYDGEAFIKSTGVRERRYSPEAVTSDLCYAAAERLIEDLGWTKDEIDGLVFVTQTADYVLPATACILQDRLGLSRDTFAYDIELGCSGWVYGIAAICGLLAGGAKKALLLCGDARKKVEEKPDPLFGFAGTATALEVKEGAGDIMMQLGTDGSGFDTIITPGGASRGQISPDSFTAENVDGQMLTPLQGRMKGMDVFSFAITTAPKSMKKTAEHFGYDYQDMDFYVLHQANKMINDMLVKKLKLADEKVPSSLEFFGNTSSASIPLTIVTQLEDNPKIREDRCRFLTCGFGVGLSWGTAIFETDKLVISKLVEV